MGFLFSSERRVQNGDLLPIRTFLLFFYENSSSIRGLTVYRVGVSRI